MPIPKLNFLLKWTKERIPVDVQDLKSISNEPVPNHLKHWWFALGGTPAILFCIQIVTGIFLLFYGVKPLCQHGAPLYLCSAISFTLRK